ncbi:glycosyltransferase family 39 protein, partial [Candidatus Omnitrophota bacterium]
MEIIKRLLYRLGKWEYIWISLLVLATLAMHFSLINQPGELVFDEQYYVNDARSILNGDSSYRQEHPPLGQLLVAFSMLLFGDNPLGWRFLSIIFGTAGIVFFYLICRQLAMSRRASFLATFLLALENQSFIQASVAMPDVYSVTFMLISFWLYLKGNYPLAGVLVCFSTLAKLSGALALPAIVLHWLLVRRDRSLHFSASMILAPLLFIVLIPLFDFAIFRQLIDPVTRIATMLSMSSSVTFTLVTHPYASYPWEWKLQPQIMPYWYLP